MLTQRYLLNKPLTNLLSNCVLPIVYVSFPMATVVVVSPSLRFRLAKSMVFWGLAGGGLLGLTEAEAGLLGGPQGEAWDIFA